jgi:hypothetical protein
VDGDSRNAKQPRRPVALSLFWLAFATGIVWGASAAAFGIHAVLPRIVAVVSASVFLGGGALLLTGFRGALDDTMDWLAQQKSSVFARRPRLYGLFFIFLGIVIVRVAFVS